MSSEPLLIEVTEGVALLTLNRPMSLNALNRLLRESLVAALRTMDEREDVRVIILTGTGRAFCVGLDVKEIGRSGDNVTDSVGSADIGATIGRLRTPIIAAINGLAVTGGFEITLACDMVFAAESAYFQDTHAKIGLLPGWGISQRLQRVVGPYRAKEISLSARKVPAAEAVTLGFVSRMVPDAELLTEVRVVAQAIAQWSPKHIERLKSLIDRGYAMQLGEALLFEASEARKLNMSVALPLVDAQQLQAGGNSAP
jgi:enoyl-CoA hydratase